MNTGSTFAQGLVEMLNEHMEELEGAASLESSFEDLDIDSLTCVELSVLLMQRFQITISEFEVASTGSFRALADMVESRITEAGG